VLVIDDAAKGFGIPGIMGGVNTMLIDSMEDSFLISHMFVKSKFLTIVLPSFSFFLLSAFRSTMTATRLIRSRRPKRNV